MAVLAEWAVGHWVDIDNMIQPVDTGADIAQPVIGIGVETAAGTSTLWALPVAGTAVVLEAEFEWDPIG